MESQIKFAKKHIITKITKAICESNESEWDQVGPSGPRAQVVPGPKWALGPSESQMALALAIANL